MINRGGETSPDAFDFVDGPPGPKPRTRPQEVSTLNLDDTICYCFHVPKRKIINFIRIHRPRRASQISECGGAGTGCGWCVPYLKRYFEEVRAGTIAESETITPEEYEQMRADYIRSGKGTPPPGAIPLPADQDGP